MTITELQIQLDLNPDNRVYVLKNVDTCRLTVDGYLFVDQEDGQCYLFDEYGNLDDISNVKSFEYGAFAYCTSLKSIKIPNSVKLIGYRAFESCTSLKSIKIPSSIEWIGDWAFRDCKSLKEIVIKGKTIDEVKAMGSYPWGINDVTIIKVES